MDEFGNLADLPQPHRSQLAPLRQLILDIVAGLRSVGPLAESTKWGEPSFTPVKKGIGSSVRIAPRRDGKVAVNFICHTGLVDRFRDVYSGELEFEGNRTIVIDPALPLPAEPLRHCIAMALTYHLAR